MNDQPPKLYWCNTHRRRVFDLTGQACEHSGLYRGGIMIACRVVDLTGIAEIVETDDNP